MGAAPFRHLFSLPHAEWRIGYHLRMTRWDKCSDGCTCGRHRAQRCAPGCLCGRHKPRNKYTPEQRAVAAQRRRDINRAYAARRRRENPASVLADRQRNRTHGRRYHLKSKFGLSLAQWDMLLIEQAGRCYLCQDPLSPDHVHIDHEHACCPGKKSCGRCIRGLACRWCNQGVGQFRDDPERMRRAANALQEAQMKILVQLATR